VPVIYLDARTPTATGNTAQDRFASTPIARAWSVRCVAARPLRRGVSVWLDCSTRIDAA
jgi:hypothetical protein